LGPNLVGVIPEKALKLAVNHELQERLKGDGELTLPKQILAGAGAGFCQVTFHVTNQPTTTKLH
jgi:solute carrier family 25 aspartate/glutamate transporter 12/13